jgi:YD repeat-containing protein
MNMRLLVGTLILLLTGFEGMAQYYYKDILGTRNAMDDRARLLARKVKKIKVHSFENDGTPSEGFFCEKKISSGHASIVTETRSALTGGSLLTASFGIDGRLIQTLDTSEFSATTTRYDYDGSGRVVRIESQSRSSDEDFNTIHGEEHIYRYSGEGNPQKLLVVKNTKDTLVVDLLTDEKGRVTDEIERKPGGLHYYYFYNEAGRLTDIVKMHPVLKKMLPDFIFDYDDDGLLTRMVAVEEGVSRNYVVWQYVNNDGLRIIEKCFSKDNKLMGYMEYEYD